MSDPRLVIASPDQRALEIALRTAQKYKAKAEELERQLAAARPDPKWRGVGEALQNLYERYSRGEWSNEDVKALIDAYDDWLG